MTLYDECFEEAKKEALEKGLDSVDFFSANVFAVSAAKLLEKKPNGTYQIIKPKKPRKTRKDSGVKRA